MRPLVSVCMPVRNGARWLRPALDSVLDQSFRDFEVRVLDDASTDDTGAILIEYARRDPRVLIDRVDASSGLTPALIRVCAGALGRYIARMDADDIAFPDRLERQVEQLEADDDLAVIGGAYVVLREDGTTGRTVGFPARDAQIKRALAEYNCIPHPTATFRRDAFEAVGGFRLAIVEEYDLWLRLAEHHRLANLASPVVYRREHGGQITHDLLEQQVAAMLAVVEAARSRRAGRGDPLEGREWPDASAIAPDALRSALIAAYASRIANLGDDSLVARASAVLDDDALKRLRVAVALRRAAGARSLWAARRDLVRTLPHPLLTARELGRAMALRRGG